MTPFRIALLGGALLAAGGLTVHGVGPHPHAVWAKGFPAHQDIMGKPAFSFSLKDVDGKDVELKDFRGKIVVLDFWAVWCGPCVRSLPFLQGLQDKYGDKGLAVVGLHVDDRRPPSDDVKEYLTDRSVRYTNLISTTQVDEEYLVMAMPTTYFVDRDGRIAGRHVGFNPSSSPEKIEKEVKALLGLN